MKKMKQALLLNLSAIVKSKLALTILQILNVTATTKIAPAQTAASLRQLNLLKNCAQKDVQIGQRRNLHNSKPK